MSPDLSILSIAELLEELRQREGVTVQVYAGEGHIVLLPIQGPCAVVLVHSSVGVTDAAAETASQICVS